MFKSITVISNSLLISTFAISGGLFNYFYNKFHKNKYEVYYNYGDIPKIYNSGFIIGGIIGLTIGCLRCPYVLFKTQKLEN
jgi:hypothetical protein